ncbi:MAG: M23 family metallopeptidase, partial [Bacteroidetes bacterium]|nr:M23 family metallopeptidase [Bacteroidota bacterium]
MGRLKKRTYHLFLAFKLLLILAILFLSLTIFKGNPSKVKEQNFISPLTIPMQLSGSFGELRGNHFHSGIDLRTQERTGFPVIAIGDGYVARIKVSSYGFGKVLYLAHPNGYTSVYAHLSRFSHEIHQYILKEQYKTSSFSIERFPGSAQFVFKQGDTIGFTGNTGGTTGPPLHFEIRNSGQLPMNPSIFHL